MPDLHEKKLLVQDTLRSLQECGDKGLLIAHLVLDPHKLISWNEILRKNHRGRLGLKKVEKKKIQQAITTNLSSCPTGLDLSMHLTDVQNILKTPSSIKD